MKIFDIFRPKKEKPYERKTLKASIEEALETIVYAGIVASAFLISASTYAIAPNSVIFYIITIGVIVVICRFLVLPHLLSEEKVPKKASRVEIDGNEELLAKIAPERIEIKKDYVKVNNTYLRTFYIKSWPDKLSDGWLMPLIATRTKLNISMHITPANPEHLVNDYTLEIAKVDSFINRIGQNHPKAVRAKRYSERLKAIRDALDLGETKPFYVSLYITLKALTKKELDANTQLIKKFLQPRKFKLEVPVLKMDKALKSSLPICEDALLKTKLFDSYSLRTSFPYIQNIFNAGEGVHIGWTPDYQPAFFSIWGQKASHIASIGPTRVGKSYFKKMFLGRSYEYYPPLKIFIVDPTRLPETNLSEYTPLTLKKGGQIIKFGAKGENPPIINPFDIRTVSAYAGQPVTEKIQKVLGFFETIFKLTELEMAVLKTVLPEVYAEKGITNKTNLPTFEGDSPTFSDLQQKLIEFKRSENASEQDKAICDKLARLLHPWVSSPFNNQTDISLTARWTLFDVTAVRNTPLYKPIAYIISDFIDGQVKETREPKIIVFDENHLNLDCEPLTKLQAMMAREYLKYNAVLYVSTQFTEDFLSSDDGRAILGDCHTRILFHDASISKEACTFFNLSPVEIDIVRRAKTGEQGYSEALVITETKDLSVRTKIMIESYDFEHPIITSSPQELKLMEAALYGEGGAT